MKEKTPAPRSSPDKPRILTRQAQERQRLITSTRLKDKDDERAAAVYLLGARRLVRDDGELQDVLKCSAKQIRAAHERAAQALENGDELGKYIEARSAEMEQKPQAEEQTEIMKIGEDVKEELARLARGGFDVSEDGISDREKKTRNRLANLAIVFIAEFALKMSREQSAQIAEVHEGSAKNMLSEAREEYATRGYFYDEVQKICRWLGIPAP